MTRIAFLAALTAMWGARAQLLTTTRILPTREIFRDVRKLYNLKTAPIPGSEVLVYMNGLLCCPGEDYLKVALPDGKAGIAFTKLEVATNPIVQVVYAGVVKTTTGTKLTVG
jgi:hypothetical protein